MHREYDVTGRPDGGPQRYRLTAFDSFACPLDLASVKGDGHYTKSQLEFGGGGEGGLRRVTVI